MRRIRRIWSGSKYSSKWSHYLLSVCQFNIFRLPLLMLILGAFNLISFCSKYDLYSKSKVLVDVEKVKPYYLSLIEKVISCGSSHLKFHLISFFFLFPNQTRVLLFCCSTSLQSWDGEALSTHTNHISTSREFYVSTKVLWVTYKISMSFLYLICHWQRGLRRIVWRK